MLDYFTSQYSAKPKLAKEVDLYTREESRKMAMLRAEYRTTVLGRSRRASTALKTLLTSFFSFL